MAEKGLFSLSEDVDERLRELLPLLQEGLREATAAWESFPADEDINWYGSPRALATSRWLGRLGHLTWALEEFCEEPSDA